MDLARNIRMNLTRDALPHQSLVRYLEPRQRQLVLLAILLLTGIGLQLANPQVIRYFLDTAQAGGRQGSLPSAAGLFIALALAQSGLSLAAAYTAENTGWHATNDLRRDLAHHCLRLDLPFHKTHTPGELIERIDGDAAALMNFFSSFIIQAVGSGLLVVGILVMLYRESLWVGLCLTVYTLLTLLVLRVIQRPAAKAWGAARSSLTEVNSYLEERIGGAEEIRAAGAESHALHRLYKLLQPVTVNIRRSYLMGSLTRVFTDLLYVSGYALGLALGVILYQRGQATVGTAYLLVYYIGMLSSPLQALRSQVEDLQRASASLERIQSLWKLRPQVDDPSMQASCLPDGPLAVSFQAVSFAYEDDLEADRNQVGSGNGGVSKDNVLKEITLTLEPEKVLGVLGRTGSGKTTLTRLLFRLYDPTQGALSFSGIDLRRLPLSELRRRVGLVTQDVQLFQASLRDNLTFFNRSIPDERILHALQELSLWDWYLNLPGGLDTEFASGGAGLSAGEAQLLAFTRVLLKDPGLIILDEASSRLDPVTEMRLEQAIDRLFAGRTAIVIAHRLHTVQRADEILVLENGQIAEMGTRQSLAADPASRFSQLLQTGLEEVLV